ncbi:MAG: NCS2 family permease [Verrucomicrobia bacterium]|nr:NCS2 family permease [Verrucomicrobiota bacterium]MCH8526831.1 NCS2 family permease [Kiritimatiellia bacterium]
MLASYFQLKEKGTTVRTEVLAGITTFMTMAYILAVNPSILAAAGMDQPALFTATAVSAAVATLVMAFLAKLPFALAPGMGLNAFFAFGVVLGMGHSWQFALTAVFLEGILFLILTALNIREAILNAIPMAMKHAISAGIGLFIAFIGMKNAGLISGYEPTLVTLGDVKSAPVILMMAGVLVTGVLLVLRVKGALLIGMFAVTLAGIPFGVTQVPDGNLVTLPPSLEPIFWQFEFSKIFTLEMVVVLFTFLFVDMFDTVGTLVGVSDKAGMLDEQGRIPNAKQAFFADAVGTTVGAALGTSTVTVYIESASGVTEGGKTGLTAFTTAMLFLLALFFAPIFIMVPAAATAPALVIVGVFMMSPLRKVDFDDMLSAIPAFVTLIMMPLTFSIADGIIFGLLTHVILHLATGKIKALSPFTIGLAALFVLKLAM